MGKLKLVLKGTEGVYINGALVRVDRKSTLSIETEHSRILLERYLLPEANKDDSPAHKLYWSIQRIVLEGATARTFDVFFMASMEVPDVKVVTLVETGKYAEALKTVRETFNIFGDSNDQVRNVVAG